MAAARGVRVLPQSRGIRVQSHFLELTPSRQYVDPGVATMIVLFDAKASRIFTSRFVHVAQQRK
jgi:hypothetical protein